MNSSIKIREQILKIRRAKGFSQEYMADCLEISVNSYRKLENGNTMLISPRLLQITKILNTSPEELLFDSSNKNRYSIAYEEEYEASQQEIKNLKKDNDNLNDLISLQKEKIIVLSNRINELENILNKDIESKE